MKDDTPRPQAHVCEAKAAAECFVTNGTCMCGSPQHRKVPDLTASRNTVKANLKTENTRGLTKLVHVGCWWCLKREVG